MSHKYVYLFSEGNGKMRELLGGKGANLAEMTNIGLPVPQGFTITTEACTQYYKDDHQINADIQAEIMQYVEKLEEMTGRTYSRIHIVGGGSNAGYLNELTAKATKKEIHAGPGEATAIGNITAQMLKAKEFKTIEEARTTIHESFGIKVYKA